ncbi:cyclic AMP response element-binding protein A-like isoform X2 [Tachypleus tridentatus]|uniref:cyclic AMP response element-binding protein A-like isoform X2 n=1 Tax=Tachypleus tridentatus TaxID=6853 RepID=UPI003FD47B84
MALDILGENLYDLEENYLNDIWNSSPLDSKLGDVDLDMDLDWKHMLDSRTIILHDRMMTDAVQSPSVQSADHSYSLAVDDDDLTGCTLRFQPDDKMELHDEMSECFPAIPMTSATGETEITVKQEPLSSPSSPSTKYPPYISSDNTCRIMGPAQQSLLRKPTIVLAKNSEIGAKDSKRRRLLMPNINVKLESTGFSLPPTPPSSNSSDSDGSLSPIRCLNYPSPPPTVTVSAPTSSSNKSGFPSPIIVMPSFLKRSKSPLVISNQSKGETGVLVLTEEEKRTLLAEGYPIPQRLPLSKAEERSLKKIRRKIKNKISAQESRRKKKEYVDTLEKSMEKLMSENDDFRKKVETLETTNKSLLLELQKLQSLIEVGCLKKNKVAATQTVSKLLDNTSMGISMDTLDLFENCEDKTR